MQMISKLDSSITELYNQTQPKSNSSRMERKLKFKIISCSSQQTDHPVSSLLFNAAQGWQTKRFCTFPQQITMQFYGIVNIKKIQIVSHQKKISTQVDLLCYVPTGSQQQSRFYKYGYMQFSRNESGNARQQKKITVDMNCLYVRLLFHKPYQNKENFFSQVGIYEVVFYGSQGNSNLMHMPEAQRQKQENQYGQGQEGEGADYQEEESSVYQKIAEIGLLKEQSVQAEDFDQANIYKQCIFNIKKIGAAIKTRRQSMQKALQNDDFDKAKVLKKQIQELKWEVDHVLDEEQEDGNQDYIEEQQHPIDRNQMSEDQEQLEQNEFVDPPRIKNNSKNYQEELSNSFKKSRIKQSKAVQAGYDERVVPALLNKAKTELNEDNEFEDPNVNKKIQFQIEPVEGKFIKDASQMQQFFAQEIVQKFFSRHWQLKVQSLNTIQSETKKKNKDANLIKCLLTVVKHSIRETNFQVSHNSLTLFQDILKVNRQSQLINKPAELQNDLDQISKEIIKKLSDNNGKIKTLGQNIFKEMCESALYGVQNCSISLTKSKGKLATKQVTSRLQILSQLIQKYGIGNGGNSVPLLAIDFAISQLNNPSADVRNESIHLLSIAYKKDGQKIEHKIGELKDTVAKQIKQDKKQSPVVKHKGK